MQWKIPNLSCSRDSFNFISAPINAIGGAPQPNLQHSAIIVRSVTCIWKRAPEKGSITLTSRLSCSVDATKVWEAGIATRARLIGSSVKVPFVIDEVLLVVTDLCGSNVSANWVEILVDLVFDLVGCHRRWLLLWRTETVSWLGERVLDSSALNRWCNSCADQIRWLIVARSWRLLLAHQMAVKGPKLFAHGVWDWLGVRAKRVFFAVAIRSWQVLLTLLEDLVDVDLLHCRARDTERVAEGFVLRGIDSINIWSVNLAYTSLMLLELLVTEAIFTYTKSCADSLSLAKAFLHFVTESLCILLRLREARRFAKSELLLRSRIVNGRPLADCVCHYIYRSLLFALTNSLER